MIFLILFMIAQPFASSLPEALRGASIPGFSMLAIDNETEFTQNDLRAATKMPGTQRLVLAFFATWCENCRKEFFLLKKHKKELDQKGVRVYLIDVGESIHKDSDKVSEFVKKYAGDAFLFYFDPHLNVLKNFGLIEKTQTRFELPITIVLDTELKVLKVLRKVDQNFPKVLWR